MICNMLFVYIIHGKVEFGGSTLATIVDSRALLSVLGVGQGLGVMTHFLRAAAATTAETAITASIKYRYILHHCP